MQLLAAVIVKVHLDYLFIDFQLIWTDVTNGLLPLTERIGNRLRTLVFVVLTLYQVRYVFAIGFWQPNF